VVVQISLAVVFLFAGGVKLVLPTETLGLPFSAAVFIHLLDCAKCLVRSD
jgi:hypothetical protein